MLLIYINININISMLILLLYYAVYPTTRLDLINPALEQQSQIRRGNSAKEILHCIKNVYNLSKNNIYVYLYPDIYS